MTPLAPSLYSSSWFFFSLQILALTSANSGIITEKCTSSHCRSSFICYCGLFLNKNENSWYFQTPVVILSGSRDSPFCHTTDLFCQRFLFFCYYCFFKNESIHSCAAFTKIPWGKRNTLHGHYPFRILVKLREICF